MSRNYYYLIAGMPEIAFDQKKPQFTQDDFKDYLKSELHPSDFKTLEVLYLVYDNENVLNMLFQKPNSSFNKLGNFTKEEVEDAIKEPESGLTTYLLTFIEEFKQAEDQFDTIKWERRLLALYYEYLFNINNSFLKEWFEFEFMLKSVITTISLKKHGIDPEKHLIFINEQIKMMANSGSKDLGLTAEWDYIDKVNSIMEVSDILHREEAIDALKWKWLDNATTFDYFSFELVIAILLKLRIVDRWCNLDSEKGKQLFEKLIEDITSGFKIE